MFKNWLIATLVFVFLDMIWLSVIMSEKYTKALGYLAVIKDGSIKFNLTAGLIAQIIIITGISLVLMKILTSQSSLLTSIKWGAFLGFVIYATYDLTNLSFIKNWPLDITIIDIAWGSFQGAIAGIVLYLLI